MENIEYEELVQRFLKGETTPEENTKLLDATLKGLTILKQELEKLKRLYIMGIEEEDLNNPLVGPFSIKDKENEVKK